MTLNTCILTYLDLHIYTRVVHYENFVSKPTRISLIVPIIGLGYNIKIFLPSVTLLNFLVLRN